MIPVTKNSIQSIMEEDFSEAMSLYLFEVRLSIFSLHIEAHRSFVFQMSRKANNLC